MEKKGFVIAIDGPVAAGKGTIAPALARRLNGFHLYTGAMYRCLALYCQEHHISVIDQAAVENVLPQIHVDLQSEKVFLNNVDVTQRLQNEDIARIVSYVSTYKRVREVMVQRQREIAQKYLDKGIIVVAEGRDVATVIFPSAEFKLFLTAKPEIRAQRRLNQLHEQGDVTETYQEVLVALKQRDQMDTEREVTPLVKDPQNHGYFVFNSSTLTPEQTVDGIEVELRKRGLLQ